VTLFWFFLACGPADPEADTDPVVDTDPVEDTDTDPPAAVEVTVVTRDGVTLVADHYAAEGADRPGLVLLHMIPPTWDRTSWPVGFVTRLQAHDWHVLVLDRRGAGESEGVASEAYDGEKGAWDVEAAVAFLKAQGAGDIALLGASNGTTSQIDYAVIADLEGLTEPVAMGFMTGGTYTEEQHEMPAVPPVPSVFTYSTAENEWSLVQQTLNPGSWVFHEYADGAHGTQMFDAAPQVADDLDAFYVGVLGG
jgi:pimeloyl-ACP methyl ester carboxylesterase